MAIKTQNRLINHFPSKAVTVTSRVAAIFSRVSVVGLLSPRSALAMVFAGTPDSSSSPT
jgi:hypothetical protein